MSVKNIPAEVTRLTIVAITGPLSAAVTRPTEPRITPTANRPIEAVHLPQSKADDAWPDPLSRPPVSPGHVPLKSCEGVHVDEGVDPEAKTG